MFLPKNKTKFKSNQLNYNYKPKPTDFGLKKHIKTINQRIFDKNSGMPGLPSPFGSFACASTATSCGSSRRSRRWARRTSGSSCGAAVPWEFRFLAKKRGWRKQKWRKTWEKPMKCSSIYYTSCGKTIRKWCMQRGMFGFQPTAVKMWCFVQRFCSYFWIYVQVLYFALFVRYWD